MGIAYGGGTLKDAVADAERLFKNTGHIYGLERTFRWWRRTRPSS